MVERKSLRNSKPKINTIPEYSEPLEPPRSSTNLACIVGAHRHDVSGDFEEFLRSVIGAVVMDRC